MYVHSRLYNFNFNMYVPSHYETNCNMYVHSLDFTDMPEVNTSQSHDLIHWRSREP